jgi:regulator of nucleoside diphosphate kinase
MSATRRPISAAASPAITVSIEEADRLASLAELAFRGSPEVVHLLLDEIDRAELLPLGDMPTDVVTMHMYVEYRDDETSAIRRIQLVYPHEADITRGKISVLTLVGAGLIGLSAGQSILWPKQDGRRRSLTVLRVSSRPLGSEVCVKQPGSTADACDCGRPDQLAPGALAEQ